MKFRWDKKYLYWGVTALLVIVGGLTAYYLMFHGGILRKHLSSLLHICMPIIDGFILAWLLCPIVNTLERRFLHPLLGKLTAKRPSLKSKEKALNGICRGVSIILALIFVFFLLSGFFRVVIPQVISSIQSIIKLFPEYVSNISIWAQKLLADNPDIEQTVVMLIDTYSVDIEEWLNKSILPQINNLLKTVSLSMISLAKALWNLILGLIISIYLLASKEKFLGQAKKLIYAFLDTRYANDFIEDARLINSTFGGFISGKILDSFIIGIICFVGANILKLPYPMLISVIVGVTNIIPFFGPFIGAIPSALLILMVNPVQCIYFIIFVVALQQFDGNFLGPKILGESTGLPGFWVLFSITLFSGIMGVPGMVLGVPTFAVFYALLKHQTNHHLKQKGFSTDTEQYRTLDHIDEGTGSFYQKSDDEQQKKTAKNQGITKEGDSEK